PSFPPTPPTHITTKSKKTTRPQIAITAGCGRILLLSREILPVKHRKIAIISEQKNFFYKKAGYQ
ncbi:MAG: hypothetical protein IKR69_06870, partial [Bacteroidales bacterium]|nr:hypothetical protein [Bacteroidales bacterium]